MFLQFSGKCDSSWPILCSAAQHPDLDPPCRSVAFTLLCARGALGSLAGAEGSDHRLRWFGVHAPKVAVARLPSSGCHRDTPKRWWWKYLPVGWYELNTGLTVRPKKVVGGLARSKEKVHWSAMPPVAHFGLENIEDLLPKNRIAAAFLIQAWCPRNREQDSM